ncbi:hypothetical protein C8J57DRAFT_1527873 [Mycena rebaudengoi]|nr:hypothetical protein C8J57DRAFT_1527873 [Mycena rebaudengoi]
MCFCISHDILCPLCLVALSNVVSVLRCAAALRFRCPPWDNYRRIAPFPGPIRFLDYIDAHSENPYRDLRFIIRPCEACAHQYVRALRLVKHENELRSRRDLFVEFDPFTDFDHSLYYTKPMHGYSALHYPIDLHLTPYTAPIFMPAISLSLLEFAPFLILEGAGTVTGSYLADAIRDMAAFNRPAVQIDALEFMEWNGEQSKAACAVSATGGQHDVMPALDRVACRGYNAERKLWLHPFTGAAGDRADAIQMMEISGEELADVFRSYTVNGVVCRKEPYLSPDCFAHTGFRSVDLVRFVRDYDYLVRRRDDIVAAGADAGSRRAVAPEEDEVSELFVSGSVTLRGVRFTTRNVYQSEEYVE